MATITITQSNVDTILNSGVSGNYYIVEETIRLSSNDPISFSADVSSSSAGALSQHRMESRPK